MNFVGPQNNKKDTYLRIFIVCLRQRMQSFHLAGFLFLNFPIQKLQKSLILRVKLARKELDIVLNHVKIIDVLILIFSHNFGISQLCLLQFNFANCSLKLLCFNPWCNVDRYMSNRLRGTGIPWESWDTWDQRQETAHWCNLRRSEFSLLKCSTSWEISIYIFPV